MSTAATNQATTVLNARSKGACQKMIQQPTEGRSREGGFRATVVQSIDDTDDANEEETAQIDDIGDAEKDAEDTTPIDDAKEEDVEETAPIDDAEKEEEAEETAPIDDAKEEEEAEETVPADDAADTVEAKEEETAPTDDADDDAKEEEEETPPTDDADDDAKEEKDAIPIEKPTKEKSRKRDAEEGETLEKKKKKKTEAVAVRKHTRFPDAAWSLSIPSPSNFASFLQQLGILEACTFRVVAPASDLYKFDKITSSTITAGAGSDNATTAPENAVPFSGVYVECMNNTMTVLIVARQFFEVKLFQKEADIDKDDMIFTFNLKEFSAHIGSITPSHFVEIVKCVGDNSVKICNWSQAGRSGRIGISSVNLQTTSADEFSISDLEYTWSIWIDTTALRGICKTAENITSSTIRIRLLRPKVTRGDVVEYFFVVNVKGDQSSEEQCFRSAMTPRGTGDASTVLLRNVDDDSFDMGDEDDDCESGAQLYAASDLELLFDESLPIATISPFIKSLAVRNVSIRMAKELPVILTAALGDEHSFTALVVAPIVDAQVSTGFTCFM